MQQLLLWNNTLYTSTLASAFGSENVITNNDDFVAIKDQLERFSSLIVLCELEWLGDGTSRSGQITSADPEVFNYITQQVNKDPMVGTSDYAQSDLLLE